GASAGLASPQLRGGSFLPGHLCRRPATGPGPTLYPTGAAVASTTICPGWRPISGRLSLDPEHFLRPSFAASRAPGLLLFQQVDLECHTAGHGRHGLLPFRTPL